MNKNPPVHNEFEISVFGAGIGECIIVHLGNGQWAVVDSCRSSITKRPIALDYLEGLGVNVSSQVSLVVITHWHDDHCDGVSEIIREAKNSRLVMSSALRSKEFRALVELHNQTKLVEATSGVAEFHESLLNCLDNNPNQLGPHVWASEGTILCQPNALHHTEIRAVSPSAQTVSKASIQLGQLYPIVNSPIVRLKDVTPNALSIVLQVKYHSLVCLLGADLEYTKDEFSGWIAVARSMVKIDEKAKYYKIAHHGSKGADGEEIWDTLLVGRPLAVATTYARGKLKLPTREDINRIRNRAERLLITSPNRIGKPRRPRVVERTISEVAKNRTVLPKLPGHVRMRYIEGQGIVTDTFDGAEIMN